MRYVITQLWFGYNHEIEITRGEFVDLQDARSKLLLLSSLEDKFMLLLENYEELEQEIMRLSLHRMIYFNHSLPILIDNIRLLNRRFANLLTTCRLYKDHSAHDISTIYGKDSNHFADYEQLHARYYEQKLGYRVMEAARNFLQHRSLVIHGTSHQTKRIKENGRVVHLGAFNFNTRELREEGGFKSAVLSELEQIADKSGNVDIRPLVREYISALGEIHLDLRKMFQEDATKFDLMILDTIHRLNTTAHENHDSVYIVAYKDENKIESKFPLLRDFVERRHRIINNTQHVTHYATNYVSSE